MTFPKKLQIWGYQLGLPVVNKNANFRAALVHLGNELVKNELVSLSKKPGLSNQDIDIL